MRFTAGYTLAVLVGVLGMWVTMEIEDAVLYGRLPLFILLFPDHVLKVLRLTANIMPICLLLALPCALVSLLIMKRRGRQQWWHFVIAGAVCPLLGITALQLLTFGRFFNRSIVFLALELVPTGIFAALVLWFVAFRQREGILR
ncbi:hypothetical protein ACFSE1_09820 [Rhizobium helianthi]|uniref:Transmembrane protein n=1 Tax=Rhizobium helianthi TaxID=1132695 RepID=A0ABW4M462_9HYPH